MAGKLLDDVSLAALWSLIKGKNATKAQVTTGSYTGTGTYGEDSPNSLTFDFEPKLLIVMSNAYSLFNGPEAEPAEWFLAINGIENIYSAVTTNTNELTPVYFTWSGNTVRWYEGTKDKYQLNYSGRVYRYIAVG